MATREERQQLQQAARQRVHERHRAAEAEEARALAERVRLLEDWCAAEGAGLRPLDRLLIELVARSPQAWADAADIISR